MTDNTRPETSSPPTERDDDRTGSARRRDRQTAVTSSRRPDDVETSVPDGAPVARCSYCGRPFVTEQYLALHQGLAHETALTADELDAYESALAAETADIRRFRIIALGGLVALYFGLLFAYAVFA